VGIFNFLSHLPELSREQLQQLAARVAFLLGDNKKGAREDGDGIETWLLDGIRYELKCRGLPDDFPLAAVKRWKQYKEFSQVAPHVGEWLDGLIPDMTRVERVSLSNVAAETLAYHLSTFTTVGLEQMLHFYGRVPDAFNNAFPGYAANNWVRMILR